MKKLQILIPQYEETDEVIQPLLDSIAIQQQVDLKKDVGVIIVNDGSGVFLSDKLLCQYPFEVQYYHNEHKGVSATRNACLDHADAEYVMFCDADDMFMNVCGLYILFREMEQGGFDSLVSTFIEETRDPITGAPVYINREIDSTFVHGKVHRRAFLQEEHIRWNNSLTVHEDSYFNCLCQKLAKELKYCPTPFYLWKWRDASVCRRDPKYILKTYNNMLESNTALVREFMRRSRSEDAAFYVTTMVLDAYFTMNKQEWLNQENQSYRNSTEQRFRAYWLEFKHLFESMNEQARNQIIMGIKNRFYGEGLMMESITFQDWISHVEEVVS